jgi:hypothetical protein
MGDAVSRFVQERYTELLAILPTILLLAGLFFIIGIDPYIHRKQRGIMLILGILVFSLVLQNYVEYLLTIGRPRIMLRRIVSCYGYSIRPVILLMFLHVVSPKKKLGWEWTLIGVNAAVYIVSVFVPLAFTIDQDNRYHSLPLFGYTCMLVSLALLALLFFRSFRVFSLSLRREAWIPVFAVALILFSLLLDSHVGSVLQPVSFLTVFIVLSCVLFYIWLHLQFAREHEQALQTEKRVQLMLSQIKPHFLYNTLGAIEELCDSDPATAKEAVIKFSEYLRGNMSALSAAGLIPFEQELSHSMLYLELEQYRFEDALKVIYDIRSTDFGIPALTLEPIVENAVRHGIRSKPGGRGTVVISSLQTPDGYEVNVQDDGPGFVPGVLPDDGRNHVGIQNVRERLRSVCGGELLIRSEQGLGTSVTIRIPEQEK